MCIKYWLQGVLTDKKAIQIWTFEAVEDEVMWPMIFQMQETGVSNRWIAVLWIP